MDHPKEVNSLNHRRKRSVKTSLDCRSSVVAAQKNSAAAPSKKRKREEGGGATQVIVVSDDSEEEMDDESVILIPSKSLLDLPNEIIDQIFSHLEMEDRLKARVCKRLAGIEQKVGMAANLKPMKVFNIQVYSNYVKIQSENCKGIIQNYNSAITILKQMARTFKFDEFYILLNFDTPFNSVLFSLIPHFTITSKFTIYKVERTPKTTIDFALLQSLLLKNIELNSLEVYCRVIISAEEMKKLREMMYNRVGMKIIVLEDVTNAAVKSFGQSVMGIDPDQMMDPKKYETYFTPDRCLNLSVGGIITRVEFEGRKGGRRGKLSWKLGRTNFP